MRSDKENNPQECETSILEVLPKEDEIPQELLHYIVSVVAALVDEKVPSVTDVQDAIAPFLLDCGISGERTTSICESIVVAAAGLGIVAGNESTADPVTLEKPVRMVDCPSISSSSSSSATALEKQNVLEYTLEVAYEKGCTDNRDEFIQFMNAHITPQQAKRIIQSEQSDNSGRNIDINMECYFEDLWYTRCATASSHNKSDICCELCERSETDVPLTLHHVFPKETHKRLLSVGSSDKVKKNDGHGLDSIIVYTKEVLSTTVKVCRLCHSTIHSFFDNDELASHYYTIEKLLADDRIKKHAKWASGQLTRRKR